MSRAAAAESLNPMSNANKERMKRMTRATPRASQRRPSLRARKIGCRNPRYFDGSSTLLRCFHQNGDVFNTSRAAASACCDSTEELSGLAGALSRSAGFVARGDAAAGAGGGEVVGSPPAAMNSDMASCNLRIGMSGASMVQNRANVNRVDGQVYRSLAG